MVRRVDTPDGFQRCAACGELLVVAGVLVTPRHGTAAAPCAAQPPHPAAFVDGVGRWSYEVRGEPIVGGVIRVERGEPPVA